MSGGSEDQSLVGGFIVAGCVGSGGGLGDDLRAAVEKFDEKFFSVGGGPFVWVDSQRVPGASAGIIEAGFAPDITPFFLMIFSAAGWASVTMRR